LLPKKSARKNREKKSRRYKLFMSARKSHTYPKPDALTETVGRLLALGIVRLRLKQD